MKTDFSLSQQSIVYSSSFRGRSSEIFSILIDEPNIVIMFRSCLGYYSVLI